MKNTNRGRNEYEVRSFYELELRTWLQHGLCLLGLILRYSVGSLEAFVTLGVLSQDLVALSSFFLSVLQTLDTQLGSAVYYPALHNLDTARREDSVLHYQPCRNLILV